MQPKNERSRDGYTIPDYVLIGAVLAVCRANTITPPNHPRIKLKACICRKESEEDRRRKINQNEARKSSFFGHQMPPPSGVRGTRGEVVGRRVGERRGRRRSQDGAPVLPPVRFSGLNKHYLSVANKPSSSLS